MARAHAATSAFLLGVGVLLAGGWYAAAPMPASERRTIEALAIRMEAPELSSGSQDTPGRRSLDRSVFDVVLWHGPPPESPPLPPVPTPPDQPVRPVAVPRPPPPPEVDLLAITRGPEGFAAVLYDRRTDALRQIRVRDELGAYRVSDIGPTWVRLERQSGESVLRLGQPRLDGGEHGEPDA